MPIVSGRRRFWQRNRQKSRPGSQNGKPVERWPLSPLTTSGPWLRRRGLGDRRPVTLDITDTTIEASSTNKTCRTYNNMDADTPPMT